MTGIDQEKMEELIEKNKLYIATINNSSLKLRSTLGEVSDDYSGRMLDSMFSPMLNGIEDLKKIDTFLESYIDFLNSVKKSYVLQDINFGQQFGRKSS